jgi:hypothetical protein
MEILVRPSLVLLKSHLILYPRLITVLRYLILIGTGLQLLHVILVVDEVVVMVDEQLQRVVVGLVIQVMLEQIVVLKFVIEQLQIK